ncbi:MAG: serine dehydratase subunit alpha family protein [Bacteroidales bacterium]|nr:serine dehydratase subunit alpha family protein [Bacteroidales bacterium]
MVTEEQFIAILQREMIPALGCTEPVACALACAKCGELLGGAPDRVTVYVSGNIYKNGMGVGIPGTGMIGLPIAAALGAICGKVEYGLEVLKDVAVGDNLQRAKDMVSSEKVSVVLKPGCTDKLYAEAVCTKDSESAVAVIAHGHTNFIKYSLNDEVLFEKVQQQGGESSKGVEMSLREIWDFCNNVDIEKISFLKAGVEMNKAISEAGLKSEYGLQIGKTLKENVGQGILANDFLTKALITATAASDARMDGCPKPVMTNSGSGNQGITVYLPVVVAAKQFNASDEQLIRALAMSNLVSAHIHYYMGHLSALCGIMLAATGAATGIVFLMGGDFNRVANAVKTMSSDLTGMICDGAKSGCALKVYSGVSAAVQAALLAMQGIQTFNSGIVDAEVENTIKNVGIIGSVGMEQTDETILQIMCQKGNS